MLNQNATASPRPIPLAPIFDNIPITLTALSHWVMWRYVMKDGKWTKVPQKPDGSYASTTNPTTWSTFDQVCAAYLEGDFDGIGIVLDGKPLDNGLYLVGLDFDHCLVDGKLEGDPIKAVEWLNTYWEISPGGEGIRLFVLRDKLVPSCKTNKIDGKSREIYSTGRYLTVTGHTIETKEVRHVV